MICSFYHSFLRLFDKKMRPVGQDSELEIRVAVEGERSGVASVSPRIAKHEQAFACVLFVAVGKKGP